MLEVAAAGLMSLFVKVLGQPSSLPTTVQPLSWQEAKFFQLPTEPDPAAEKILEDYLRELAAKGYTPSRQGVWLQSDLTRLATHEGQRPLSAASLTKVATTIAALEKWGVDYQFETHFFAAGEVKNGVLNGDLVVLSSGDPMFVWEEAIAVGNTLNDLGIRKVTGNLVVNSNFSMNFYPNPQVAGQKLKEGLNSKVWSSEAQVQHAKMPPGTKRPTVEINGGLRVSNDRSESWTLLLRHQSLPMQQIIKQMNIYSNNAIAEILGQLAGGADVVATLAAEAANVPRAEIQLINGSGLGVANRISPRASVAMFMALDRQLRDRNLSVADLFPVAGRDKLGTMIDRALPPNTTMKTGTLAQVSALAGFLPTQQQGLVWFSIINEGGNIEELRSQQDRLVRRLSQAWGTAPLPGVAPSDDLPVLGDPQRIDRGDSDVSSTN